METLRDRYPLRWRKIIKKSFSRIVTSTVVATVITVVLYLIIRVVVSGDPETLEPAVRSSGIYTAWLILVAIVILSSPFYQYLYFRSYFYDVDDKNVIIRKGIISKREVTLPFKKITDVYVDQDIADVAFGLYDVHISTPTVESGKFAHIDGVDKKAAAAIKKMILDQVNKDEN